MKILIAGDFCPQHRVEELFSNGDFGHVLKQVKPILNQMDYSVVNYECPVTKGGETPIMKKGPNLQSSGNGIKAVKWVGFNCVTLANNHLYDFGEEGVRNTLEACQKFGIEYVGGGMNFTEASSILYKDIEGQTLAIINCCEHEFSIATDSSAGSNPLNPIQQYYAIKEARKRSDIAIVIVHGGSEHYQLPSPRMKETYRFFIDAGADAVINHHQHCFSGYEYYKGKPICYGLGNFCFDRKNRMPDTWYEGLLCSIDFKEKIDLKLIPYIQCKDSSLVKLLPEDSYSYRLEEINKVISNDTLLRQEYSKYLRKNANKYLNSIDSYGRMGSWLRRKGFLPKNMYLRKLLTISNYINCESHLDRLRDAVDSKINIKEA